MDFLSKIRVATLGAAHDVLDRAVDLNSPSSIRQYVRDLESAISKMESEAAIQDGQLRTLEREKRDVLSSIETSKATITKLLASPDPAAQTIAKTKGAVVLQNQKRLLELSKQILDQQNVAASLKVAVNNLHMKHQQMLNRVHDLERIDRDTKAKESAARAIKNAGSVIGVIDNPSVDDLESKMRRRNDVASAQFDQAMDTVHDEPVDSDDLKALLDELKPAETVAK